MTSTRATVVPTVGHGYLASPATCPCPGCPWPTGIPCRSADETLSVKNETGRGTETGRGRGTGTAGCMQRVCGTVSWGGLQMLPVAGAQGGGGGEHVGSMGPATDEHGDADAGPPVLALTLAAAGLGFDDGSDDKAGEEEDEAEGSQDPGIARDREWTVARGRVTGMLMLVVHPASPSSP